MKNLIAVIFLLSSSIAFGDAEADKTKSIVRSPASSMFGDGSRVEVLISNASNCSN
jgi:hypothetical protein